MSVQAVNQFLQKVSEDEKLQQELAQALQSDQEGKEVATALAAKHGYQFSASELWQEIQNRQNQFEAKQSSGELNEDELEAVAGGSRPSWQAMALTPPAIAHHFSKQSW